MGVPPGRYGYQVARVFGGLVIVEVWTDPASGEAVAARATLEAVGKSALVLAGDAEQPVEVLPLPEPAVPSVDVLVHTQSLGDWWLLRRARRASRPPAPARRPASPSHREGSC